MVQLYHLIQMGPVIQPVFTPVKSAPVQAMGSPAECCDSNIEAFAEVQIGNIHSLFLIHWVGNWS